jgi:zinc transport system substrate-binding protein
MRLIQSKKKTLRCFLGFALIVCVLGLPSYSFAVKESTSKLTVYVVNYPLKYFAERIAGEHARVVFPVPGNVDPAFWMPDAETIQQYQRADLILLNGAHYAKWVQKVTLPQFRLVDTSSDFKNQLIRTEKTVTHHHGPEGKHSHEGTAFTTWLDFNLAIQHAQAIEKAFYSQRPDLGPVFKTNLKKLEQDLRKLDLEIKTFISGNSITPLVVSHPVYQYLARAYGLNIVSLLWEPDKIPDDREWNKLRAILKSHPARWMVWEREPERPFLARLKSMGMESLVFDPCGNVPEKGDFLSVMRQNIENLKQAFK